MPAKKLELVKVVCQIVCTVRDESGATTGETQAQSVVYANKWPAYFSSGQFAADMDKFQTELEEEEAKTSPNRAARRKAAKRKPKPKAAKPRR
jgi:hypothetical protein